MWQRGTSQSCGFAGETRGPPTQPGEGGTEKKAPASPPTLWSPAGVRSPQMRRSVRPQGTPPGHRAGGKGGRWGLKCRPADEERTAAGKTELLADPWKRGGEGTAQGHAGKHQGAQEAADAGGSLCSGSSERNSEAG